MILLEGIRNLALPCTLSLVLPSLVAVAVGRLRPVATAAVVLGAGATAWAQAVGWLRPGRGAVWQLVLAGMLAVAGGLLWSRRGSPPVEVAQDAVGGFVAGGVTASLWEPCVGELLGRTLTAAPTDPAGTLLPMLAFVIGALLPVWALAGVALGTGDRVAVASRRIGGTAAVVLTGLVAVGWWHDVVSWLVRVTLA